MVRSRGEGAAGRAVVERLPDRHVRARGDGLGDSVRPMETAARRRALHHRHVFRARFVRRTETDGFSGTTAVGAVAGMGMVRATITPLRRAGDRS